MEKDVLKARLLDCIPPELMEKIEMPKEDPHSKEPKRLRGIDKILHIKLN
jgi:hypothetical protein